MNTIDGAFARARLDRQILIQAHDPRGAAASRWGQT
jgi:hypothetical protein